MRIFRKALKENSSAEWTPTFSMASARPLVLDLAETLAWNAEVRATISAFVRLSGTPVDSDGIYKFIDAYGPGEIQKLPWKWLSVVLSTATVNGDHQLAAAGLYWALIWKSFHVPRMIGRDFEQLGLYECPAPLESEIRQIGRCAASALPGDAIIAGSGNNTFSAKQLLDLETHTTGQVNGISPDILKRLLPANLISMMERFGRSEIDPMSNIDPTPDKDQDAWWDCQQSICGIAIADPEAFVSALATECVPVGGWAVFGADLAVTYLYDIRPISPDSTRLIEASIEFLRSNFVPPEKVRNYLWTHYISNGGTANTWIPLSPSPSREEAKLTPLSPGEVRWLLRFDKRPDSNFVVIRQDEHEFIAFIDGEEDRILREWKRASNQYDLYHDIAWSIQSWETADPELEPFFPAPKALI